MSTSGVTITHHPAITRPQAHRIIVSNYFQSARQNGPFHHGLLELPAYLPETNQAIPWAIAGGHMSMATYKLLALEGDTSVECWTKAITERGLYYVRDDLLGLCKFAMLNTDAAPRALACEVGLNIPKNELRAAVRRAFIRALWLERKQGYGRSDYTLPSQVFDAPNPHVKCDPFITRDFFAELSARVWKVFDKEIAAL